MEKDVRYFNVEMRCKNCKREGARYMVPFKNGHERAIMCRGCERGTCVKGRYDHEIGEVATWGWQFDRSDIIVCVKIVRVS